MIPSQGNEMKSQTLDLLLGVLSSNQHPATHLAYENLKFSESWNIFLVDIKTLPTIYVCTQKLVCLGYTLKLPYVKIVLSFLFHFSFLVSNGILCARVQNVSDISSWKGRPHSSLFKAEVL